MFPESTCTQLTPFLLLLLPPQMPSHAKRVHRQSCSYRPSPPIFQQVLTASGSIEPHKNRTAHVPSLSHSASMGSPTKMNLQEIFYVTSMCEESFPSMMTYSFKVIVLWCHEAYSRRHCTNPQWTPGNSAMSSACFFSCLVAWHEAPGGATSEELPSLHPGKSSSQAAHDLLSAPKPSLGESCLRLG